MNAMPRVPARITVFLLLAAVLLRIGLERANAEEHRTSRESALGHEYLVDLDPEAESWLLDAWRWKVGPAAKIYRVTVFGDIFVQAAGSQILLLDTGYGTYTKVADSPEQWAEKAMLYTEDWFRPRMLKELHSLGIELEAGYVFSWRHLPMLGGREVIDNIDFVPATVHAIWSGQTAKVIEDLGPGATAQEITSEMLRRRSEAAGDEASTIEYNVVINEEMQYSLWPVGRSTPSGWKAVGKSGTKQECIEYIERVWTDMRPLSLQEKSDGRR